MRALPLAVVVLIAAGCGGRGSVVRIVATAGNGTPPVVADAVARANGREAPLEVVEPLLPRPLPHPLPRPRHCNGVGRVEIVFSRGGSVGYDPCRAPRSVELLRVALLEEAWQWRAPPVATTRIVAPTARERTRLRATLRRFGPTRIREIRLGDTLRIDAGRSLRGEWEAALFAERFGRADVLETPSGTEHVEPAPPTTPIRLDRVRAAVRRTGASIAELRTESGALALVVRVGDPARYLVASGPRLVEIVRGAHALNRVYVAVQDRAGAIVYAWGWLPNQGMLAPRPDLDACGPIEHFVGARSVDVSCPAPARGARP